MSGQPFHRYHALDALRAAMMLLGLVLHSAVSYVVAPLGAAWPYKDPSTSTAFDLLVFVIHLFRMPVFFVVAGFFAAMLMQRDGPAILATNRAKRVLLPLVLLWPLIYPGIAAGFLFANGRLAGTVDMTPVTSGAFLKTATLGHLWFLWDLVIFYGVCVMLAPLGARLPVLWGRQLDALFGRAATTIAGAFAMALVTTVSLLPMEHPALDTSFSLLPPIRILLAYGVFFAFGWMMYRRRDLIEPFGARWKAPMLVGLVASGGYLVVTVGKAIAEPRMAHVIGCALAGLSIWMLIFGIVGLFVSRLHRPRPIVRYLSDASYWMYIVHLPIAIALPGLMAPWGAPAAVKFSITLATTAAVTLLSYHYLVRATALGALLNGRRYPRRMPELEPVREAVSV